MSLEYLQVSSIHENFIILHNAEIQLQNIY